MKVKIKLKLKPTFQVYPRNSIETEDQFFVYSCYPTEKVDSVELNPTYQTFTVAGKIQKLELNQEYMAELTKSDKPYSYDVVSIYQELPSNGAAQREFFRALLTDRQFKSLYNAYGLDKDLINMFKNDEIDTTKVHGFGEATYKKIKEKIMKNLDYQVLIAQLSKYGITYNTIIKLIDLYGNADYAAKKVKEHPYSLTELDGIGFVKADTIAKNMKTEELENRIQNGEITIEEGRTIYIEQIFKNPERIKEGLKHAIKDNQNNGGHTFIYVEDLVNVAKELLQIKVDDLIMDQIQELKNQGLIYFDGDRVALKSMYQTEHEVADWLLEKLSNKSKILNFDVDDFIKRSEEKYNIQLTDQQKQLFINIKHHEVNLLVGNAGMGKTFMQVLVRDLLEELNISVKYLAPTGSASKVLSKYIERHTSTIHKAIGYGSMQKTNNDRYSEDEPNFDNQDANSITEDFIVVDETSMLDVVVFNMMLCKIKNPNTRLLFIGDNFQIPSVAAGNLLHDMIESNIVPTTTLDIVFRQKEGGALDVATKIRKGEKFLDSQSVGEYEFGKDFIVNCVEQEYMKELFEHYYNDLLHTYKNIEIMTLSPKRDGDLGVKSLNHSIQKIVNPQLPFDKLNEIQYNENITFRENDYIVNIKNTYDKETINGETIDIMNGDKGRIIKINTERAKSSKEDEYNLLDLDKKLDTDMSKKGVYIQFDDYIVHFKNDELGQLLHAWAITIHRAQGSGSDAVIILIDKSHTYQMNANLLYTAITRLRKFGILLCQPEVINRSIKKVANLTRNTFLQEMLKGGRHT